MRAFFWALRPAQLLLKRMRGHAANGTPARAPSTEMHPQSHGHSSSRDATAPMLLPSASAETRERFARVFRAEFDFVSHSLRRLGVPPRDLDDVTHDTFVAVFRKFDTYDVERPVRPWLFGFAYRIASDYRNLARHSCERFTAHSFATADRSPRADELLEAHEVERRVHQTLDALDSHRRALLVMHDVDGHSMPAIASNLGVPLNTAYSRLRLARRTFGHVFKKVIP